MSALGEEVARSADAWAPGWNVVQAVLGHAQLSTTQIYTTPTSEDVIASVLAHHARRADGPAPAGEAQRSDAATLRYRPESLEVLFGRPAHEHDARAAGPCPAGTRLRRRSSPGRRAGQPGVAAGQVPAASGHEDLGGHPAAAGAADGPAPQPAVPDGQYPEPGQPEGRHGGRCDIKTLAREAGVDRTAFYGNRPYAHLRAEFEHRLQARQDAGDQPDPRDAQVARLKNEITTLRQRLTQSAATIDELADFRTQALARLAAQHDEITHLRGRLIKPDQCAC